MALRVMVVAGLGLMATACINSASLVTVKPDGSGTIEQTTLVNMAAFQGMMASMGAKPQKESESIMSEADFKRAAERMGVRPVSLTPLKEGGFQGAKAVYAFDDITKIRVDQDPRMTGSATGAFSGPSTKENPIKFTHVRKGGTSILTITVAEDVANTATARAQDAPSLDKIDPAMLQMVKNIFNGFRIVIDVAVDGTIVKTNADYVDGSRVTLVDVDMSAVLEDMDKLSVLQSKVQPGASLSDLRPYLKDIKGVKMNHPSVTIEYR